MEGTSPEGKHNVILNLPVKIDYKVLDTYLQKKFLGKVLSKGKANGKTSDHAKIQKIHLERSDKEDFDLAIHLQLKLLTTFFSNKEIRVLIHLSLNFKEAEQQVMIDEYKLEGENNGWFTNTLVETLINKFMYATLRNKMKFDIKPLITERLANLNNKFSTGLEVVDGITLTGKINEFRIQELIPGQRTLLVTVKILGSNVLNIQKIDL